MRKRKKTPQSNYELPRYSFPRKKIAGWLYSFLLITAAGYLRLRQFKTSLLLKKGIKRKIEAKTGTIYQRRNWPLHPPAIQFDRWKAAKALFLAILLLCGYFTYEQIFKDLPAPTKLTQRRPILTTKILDRQGRLLFRIYKDENRTLVSLSQISPQMIEATLAIEDQNFYHHFGFDPIGIFRALLANLQGKRIQGGSTITQQLVKNTLLSPEKTIKRKIKELILAILVEANYSKDEILEMYFNEIPYGGSIYGVEEAAQKFFGKPASELTLAESALLAGLPQSPSTYSPFGANPERAFLRQHEVLRRMVEEGYITADEAREAQTEKIHFQSNANNIRAPHFVMYVKKILAEKYGEEMISQGGLTVRTTLDLDLQEFSQQAVEKELNKLKRLNVTNGAVLVTNPQTGEILAMVGSRDYFDFQHDGQVNVTIRPRQPGSSIKPLTYALAFEKKLLTPSSLILDAPITYRLAGSPPYSPVNYDGRYHGLVTARQALANSYNIPAVKTLAMVGVNNLIDKAEEIGFTTWQDRRRFGLSLTLGGGEVLMTQMAQLYGTFANYGYTVNLNPILEIKNYRGETIYFNRCAADLSQCARSRNFDPRVAYQISDILSDNQARSAAFGPRSVLYIPQQQVAVKTGTTNNLRDNWTIGYTTNRLVATWVGNNDNSPMSRVVSGITGASPIWHNIMISLLDKDKPHRFLPPSGLNKITICAASNTLPCPQCPQTTTEYFLPGTEPQRHCSEQDFQKSTGKKPPDRSKLP